MRVGRGGGRVRDRTEGESESKQEGRWFPLNRSSRGRTEDTAGNKGLLLPKCVFMRHVSRSLLTSLYIGLFLVKHALCLKGSILS